MLCRLIPMVSPSNFTFQAFQAFQHFKFSLILLAEIALDKLIYPLSLLDRTKELGKPTEIEAWTGFDFLARKGQYSSLKYRWYHFTGTDYDHRTQTKGVFKFLGRGKKDWAKDVDDEFGNYDYL